MAILVIDIGGSAVKYGVAEKHHWLLHNQFPTPNTRSAFFDHIQEIINKTERNQTIDGVAVSCPGEVDEDSGKINGLSFVPFLHHGVFQHDFATFIGKPISFINDANSAALAEMTYGIGKGSRAPLFVIIGSGLGLALVDEGRVVENPTTQIDEVEQLVAAAIKDYNNAKVSPVRIGKRVSLKKWHWPTTFEGKDVFRLAENGDPIALKEIRRMYHSLAEVLLLLDSAFRPDFIGIGGGVSNHQQLIPILQYEMTSLLTHNSPMLTLYKKIFANSETISTLPEIKACAFKSHANLVGALIHFEDRFQSEAHSY